ncbi:Shedu anti-phage system protein SduA domain-containing protein, partial [Staphylococcus aureus]
MAIVEIKTPQTPLLETGAYRGEVHAPTKHLSGAITQALDQRYQLQTSINDRKISSGVFDVFSFAMQGLVIAGRDPTGPA